MKRKLLRDDQPTPAVGQVWRDNYDLRKNHLRLVTIVKIDGDTAHIKNSKGLVTKTKLKRFNGASGGFSFHPTEPNV